MGQMKNPTKFAMNISMLVAVLMLVGKLAAYYISLSTAILSDALESVVHIFATGIAFFALSLSQRPATKTYPYGYSKIVPFSVGGEGLLIAGAGVFILIEAVRVLIVGPEIRQLGLGLLITGLLGVVNLVLGWYLVHVGRVNNSPVVIANGKHILTDMVTSFSVVAGVAVVWFTGVLWLDGVVALIAGLQILYTASLLLKEAYAQAMDRVSPGDSRQLEEVLNGYIDDGQIQGWHQLRHRGVGEQMWVEFHLLFPPDMTVLDAHDIATRIEDHLEKVFDKQKVVVTSHIEPHNHNQVHPDGHPMPDALSS